MEEDAFMQLNYKDMKKWYNNNAELKEKELALFISLSVDMVLFHCSGRI